ncbi:bestrophin family protein [Oceanimonas marisflavi]|uniref:bestrophin family protein n=1 Tax=Oceanimonas marisflavi TaxID=2059724 RepID=UPI000D3182C8|nr:bestrophin family ion channel [Oceanimonas marisflavi]
MIVRQRPHALKLFFTLRGSVIQQIYPQLLIITLLSSLVATIQHVSPGFFPSYTTTPFALLGIALSLFLGFRNNASYDRWWEAREQWGQLMIDARSLARQVISFMDQEMEAGPQTRQRLIYLTIAFVHALRHQLRDTSPWQDIDRYVEPEHHAVLRNARNTPEALLRLMGKKVGYCRRQRLLSEFLVQSMDERITSMTGVLSACERIKNTPLPFAYALLVHRTTYLYCFMLPFGLVSSLGVVTPLVCVVIAYTFFGLDALSEELEEPFGLAANDLPLSAMSRAIEISLLEALDVTELPPEITPENGYLH